MDQLVSLFKDAIESLVQSTTFADFQSSCMIENPDIIKCSTSIQNSILTSNLPFDSVTILNHITGKYLIHLHDTYTPETSDVHLHTVFVIIDLSLKLEQIEDGNNGTFANYSMHTFILLLSYIYPVEFIIEKFSHSFFNAQTERRRLLLTKNNKLQGKVKPGSRLLVLYKQLIERIPMYKSENELIISRFVQFITNSFEISDKLSHSLDWRLRNLKDISNNGYLAVFNQFKNSKKMSQIQQHKYGGSGSNSNGRMNQKSLFVEFITLMNLITTSNEQQIIQMLNKDSKQQHQTETILKSFEFINKLLNNVENFENSKLIKNPIHDKLDKQFKWILDEEYFMKQVKNYDFYWSLRLQLLILINFFKSMEFENWNNLTSQASKEYSKFRKPDNLINSVVSNDSKKKLNDWLASTKNIFKQRDFHYDEIIDLIENNERTFTMMKLKNFVHPNIPSLTSLSDNKKRKLHEYIESNKDLDSTILNKKPKFNHKLGTPKLSKLWTSKTGLTAGGTHMWLDADTVLESARDDLYFAQGDGNQALIERNQWKEQRALKFEAAFSRT